MADLRLIGTTLDGKYKLVLLLGEGGMGSVYQAEQKGTSEHVAMQLPAGRGARPEHGALLAAARRPRPAAPWPAAQRALLAMSGLSVIGQAGV